MNFNTIILSALCIITINSCKKSDAGKPCDPSIKPVVSTNSPVMAGETIQLSVSGIDNVAIINWHGPDNFNSHEANPEIPYSNGFAAGRYTVDVISKSGCVYTAVTDSVVVEGSEPACQLNDNTAQLFRNIQFHDITVTGQTQVIADSYDSDITFTFKTPGTLPTGMYRIKAQPEYRDEVDIRFLAYSAYYVAESGNVAITRENGKIVITFCDIEFKETGTYFKMKGSARLVF
ncbi:hypothetical protein EG028_21650 [Chitinophaga barathri]|uniref:Uncharacterized protein n=2 Tax=Chitinophaga barathri TaxID=1647451 RepID=A0A3N4MHV6_9BACT|nr:hypothetical protein EG028_21650 [Chitinophaga barathri]